MPWVAWQELDGAAAGTNQIFVSRAVKSTAGAPCAGKPANGAPSVNGFCWLQVGLDRIDPATGASSATGDPTLSIDPTRSAIEPDDAFTGPGDTVPWVVWYEQDPGLNGVDNELVFAAKAVPDATADGGFHWVAVGKGTRGQTNVLNGTNGFGACATSAEQERACSLNNDATVDAEDARVAAGTLTPGGATVPWVTWSETIGVNRHAIFVSRLVGGDHFETFNLGQPISNTLNDASRPDIAFSGNTPYITWQEDVGGQRRTFSGHFEGGAAAPVFKLDTPVGIARNGTADLRPPVSSTCTANPANADGAACQASALGTPFFLFADGAPGAQHLFADAYHPSDIATGTSSAVTTSSANVAASVNPGGASVKVHFEFGGTLPTVRPRRIRRSASPPPRSRSAPGSRVCRPARRSTTARSRPATSRRSRARIRRSDHGDLAAASASAGAQRAAEGDRRQAHPTSSRCAISARPGCSGSPSGSPSRQRSRSR